MITITTMSSTSVKPSSCRMVALWVTVGEGLPHFG